jgi:Protein of unknown function (DUF3300)
VILSWMRLLVFAFLILVPLAATAQVPVPEAATAGQVAKPEELEALVAPIALYPDTLLAMVLMASTYPLEVVQAERWASQNASLKDDQLKAAVDKQPWDESVRSLVATPSVLTMMSTKLDWTQKLGDAVLAQEADLMEAVQRLRAKAQTNKQLSSNKQQTVTVSNVEQKQVIAIAPAQPNTVYVPYYNPAVVYGGWQYPAYPPYYFPPPGYIAGGVIATGIAFGAGYALGRWAAGGAYWGGGVNWGGNNITINRSTNISGSGNRWQHSPEHRHGVRYNNPGVQQKFGGNTRPGGSQGRTDFRGHSGQQPKAGQQPATGKGQQAKGGKGQQAKGGKGQQGNAGKGQQAKAGKGGGGGPSAGAGGPKRDAAFGNIQSGKAANLHSQRGQSSIGSGGRGGGAVAGGGGRGGGGAVAGGGGGRGGGGGGGRGGGGGGRRSDAALKHDVALLGYLDNGLGFYRFTYHGGETVYVGVMAQEVQLVMPDAVVRGRDGYLRVFYGKLGLRFQSYEQWLNGGAQIPSVRPNGH